MGMDEYIDREAAYKTIMGEPPDAHYPQWYADKIMSIPAADVRPVVRGKWKPAPWFAIHDCDECDQCRIKIQCGRQYNFCPNCGADMRGCNDER